VKPETKYEKLVIALSVFLLVLVCGTGIWVYMRLSTVADKIGENTPKDAQLLILKELNTDLIKAENYMYAYSFREQDTILRAFYRLANNSEVRLGLLKRMESNDELYARNIDTLRMIVLERYKTLEDIILVRNDNRVHDAMEQVVTEVKSLTSRNRTIPKPAQPQMTERRKLFQRRKKQEEAPATASVNPSGSSINATVINRELGEIRNDVVSQEQIRNAQQLSLEQKNNRLVGRFTRLVQTIENREKKAILREANAAQLAADETRIVIGIFCFTSILLIVFVAYLIYNLIQKTRATNRQLTIAKEKSDQLTASKSRFLANMSHEIRTPLNAIVGFAEQLHGTQLREDQERKVAIIQKSAEHLTQITNDILDISKINSGAIKLEEIPVSIRDEMQFLEESFSERAAANENNLKIAVDQEIPQFVLGDALRLRQILFNLLGNAMKFTKNGTVKLSVKPVQQSNTNVQLVFTVSDTGIGISPEHINRIFDEFEQAETSTTRDYGGTGLGLTITRNLVKLMGGEIRVKSEVGKGTSFMITIPMKISNTEQPEVLPQEKAELSFLEGKRILIVDDEVYNRKLLRNMLQKWNTSITEVGDGEEALREVEESDYDLILLDLRMPKLDGFQTREAIQALKGRNATIPIIALTAAITHEERLEMLKDNWKGVLLKPLKVKDLLQCLKPLFPPAADSAATQPADPATERPKETPEALISLEPLKEISGNDSKFYLDMLHTFYRTTKDGLDTINEMSQVKDWEGMAEAAHKIASPVKHVQATEAYELLKQLERAGRTNSIESTISQKITRLNQSIEKILNMIDVEIAKVQ
jgi:signal transduction histidine kinase/CheY-like chemotaxis protein/HPt (histidine-containing phosphotransfer) domain-containing protein